MEGIEIVEKVTPVDRTALRVAEQVNLSSKDLVKSQDMLSGAWVGPVRVTEPGEADLSDAQGTGKDAGQGQATASGSYLQFVVDPGSHDVTVKIIDNVSGRVVRTIPPEELAKYADEMQMTPGALLETVLY